MLDIILPSVIVINVIVLNVVAPPRELSPSFWEIFDDINKEVDKDGATTFSIMTLCITTISKMTLVLLCLFMLSVAFLLL